MIGRLIVGINGNEFTRIQPCGIGVSMNGYILREIRKTWLPWAAEQVASWILWGGYAPDWWDDAGEALLNDIFVDADEMELLAIERDA